MTKKKPIFGNEGSTVTLAPEAPVAPLSAAQFVKGKTPMRRLMLEIPADLHRRMRLASLKEGVSIAKVAREFFAKRYPAEK